MSWAPRLSAFRATGTASFAADRVFHWQGGSKFAKATSAGLDLSCGGYPGATSCSCVGPASASGAQVGDRKAETVWRRTAAVARRAELCLMRPSWWLACRFSLASMRPSWAPVASGPDPGLRFIPGRLTIAIGGPLDRSAKRVNTGPPPPTGSTDPELQVLWRREAMDGADCAHAGSWTMCSGACGWSRSDRHRATVWCEVLLFGGDRDRQRARPLDHLAHGFSRHASGRFGLMGAATRFMFQPGRPLGRSARVAANRDGSGCEPERVFMERRSLIFIFIWFGTDIIFSRAQTLGFPTCRLPDRHPAALSRGSCCSLFDRPFRAPPMAGELGPTALHRSLIAPRFAGPSELSEAAGAQTGRT